MISTARPAAVHQLDAVRERERRSCSRARTVRGFRKAYLDTRTGKKPVREVNQGNTVQVDEHGHDTSTHAHVQVRGHKVRQRLRVDSAAHRKTRHAHTRAPGVLAAHRAHTSPGPTAMQRARSRGVCADAEAPYTHRRARTAPQARIPGSSLLCGMERKNDRAHAPTPPGAKDTCAKR